MKDDIKYASFVIGVKRNWNTDKIETIIVGNKQKGKPVDILSAYAGEEAQALYNILVGRKKPIVTTKNSKIVKVAYSKLDPENVIDTR
jgi:hypothetical protein